MIIVGAGPAGLASAIAAKEAGLSFQVFEKGVLVNALFRFPSQMVFFTTPDLLEIGGMPFVTPHGKPTRDEALRYYRRVIEAHSIDIGFGRTVTDVTPSDNNDSFVVRAESPGGVVFDSFAKAVIIANGCYDHPNMLGVEGENLSHVSHYYTEPHEFYRKDVVIVGGKNSAAEAALDLFRTGANVTLVHRGRELGGSIKYWVRPDLENRIKEGSIAARFETTVKEIRSQEVIVECQGKESAVPADAVFLLTGYLADLTFLRRCGVEVSESNIPHHDPETFESNVRGLYLAGAVVAGANRGEVFIENGRFHGKVVVSNIAKRLRGND